MQLVVDVKLPTVLDLIANLSLDDIEILKNKIEEVYFQKFQKDNLPDIINDFEKEGYSQDFLADLENGLKKSSVYAN